MSRPDPFAGAVEVTGKKPRGLWTTYFPDVSNNNGTVNYQEIAHNSRRTGITAVEMKATEGTSFVDGLYAHAREECARFGLRTFAYHFARPDLHPGTMGAHDEAVHFCQVVGKVEPYEWRPMLDFETAPFDPEWVKAWNATVRARLGVAPTLYSYWAALEGMRLNVPLSDGLIFALPNGLPGVATAPRPWRRWTAHQYTWHGHVAGVSGAVDLNWTPSVRSLLAFPAKGIAWEPTFLRRRRAA